MLQNIKPSYFHIIYCQGDEVANTPAATFIEKKD